MILYRRKHFSGYIPTLGTSYCSAQVGGQTESINKEDHNRDDRFYIRRIKN